MKRKLAIAALVLVAGCNQQKTEKPAEETKLTSIHSFMTERIDSDADAVWAIGNAAMDDNARMDPALMSDEQWAKLEKAATRMAQDSRDLAALEPLHVKLPGQTIADEGTEGAPTPEQIDAHLKRDPDLFRSLATSLANHLDDLSNAAAKHNAARAGQLINELDGVCESCHLEFWYPEQKKLIEEMGIETH